MDEERSGVWVRLRVWLANRLLDLDSGERRWRSTRCLNMISLRDLGAVMGGCCRPSPLGPIGAMGEVQPSTKAGELAR